MQLIAVNTTVTYYNYFQFLNRTIFPEITRLPRDQPDLWDCWCKRSQWMEKTM